MRSSYEVLLKLNFDLTFTNLRQIFCSTGKGQALTVKVESVPEMDSFQAWKRAQIRVHLSCGLKFYDECRDAT